jgi:pimeloyl-ACP methyl ester carboxylesterase
LTHAAFNPATIGHPHAETPVVNDGQPRDIAAVLVHGGFLGPWIWADTVKLLSEHKIPSVCIDLPSSRDTGGSLAGLHDDAQAVRGILDGYRDVVLCGHSYAGLVVSEAAAGPHKAVRHLVFLAAAIPDVGDSLTSLAGAGPRDNTAGQDESGGEEIDFRADGRMVLRPESARAGLFNDCTPDRADAAIALLRPLNPATGTQSVSGAAWHDIPSTYVRCTQDRLPYEPVTPAFREHAASVLTLPTGHCPQWSRPDLVAELLIRIVGQVRSG